MTLRIAAGYCYTQCVDPNDETDEERDARVHDLSRERPARERVQRSDDLEAMRTDRAENLEDVRIERAMQLRVADALRHKDVDNRLDHHEARLNAINGSIARGVEATVKLTRSVDTIHDNMKTRDAVNVALIEAAAGKGAKKLSRFQQTGVVVGGAVAMGSLLIAILQSIH